MIKVTLDTSITDKVILAIVAALVGAEISAKDKLEEWNRVHVHEKRSLDFSIDLVVPKYIFDKGITELLIGTLMYPFRVFYSDHNETKSYLLEQILTDDIITRLAAPTRRAYAQAAGMLIGAEASSLVDLSRIISLKDSKHLSHILMVLPSEKIAEYSRQLDFFQVFGEKNGLSLMLIDDTDLMYKACLELVVDATLVVGPQSFSTYAAACIGIPCIELIHTQQELNILSKWSSPKYGAVVLKDFDNLTIETMQALLVRWKALGEQVLTQQDMYRVNVDGL